jgi:hypothetical protein
VPNLANGTERVTILGVTFRITITSEGLDGISLLDIVAAARLTATVSVTKYRVGDRKRFCVTAAAATRTEESKVRGMMYEV